MLSKIQPLSTVVSKLIKLKLIRTEISDTNYRVLQFEQVDEKCPMATFRTTPNESRF